MRGPWLSPKYLLALSFLLASAALPFALNIRLNPEVADLLPDSLPSVQSFRRLQKEIGGHTFLSIVIESPDREANEKFAQTLAQRLSTHDWVHHMSGRRNVEFLRARWPFLISKNTLDEWESRLRTGLEEARVQQSPLALAFDHGQEAENWGELRRIVGDQGSATGNFREFRENANGTILLMQVQVRELTSRVDKTRIIIAEAKRDIQETQPGLYHPALQARLYGPAVSRVVEYDTLLGDLARACLITIPAILLIPALVLRSPWAPTIVVIPMLVGMAWTYAYASLAFGSLNLVTAFLFVVLFGIGDDYPIHLYSRIQEYANRCSDFGDAVRQAVSCEIRPLVYSAVADAAAFFAIGWMQFKGFSHFGLLVGGGIILVLLATLCCVPGVVLLFPRKRQNPPPSALSSDAMTTAPAKRARRLVSPRARLSLWVLLVTLSVIAVWRKAEFESNFENLRPEIHDFIELRGKTESIEGFQKSMPAVFVCDDLETSRQVSRVEQSRLDAGGSDSPILRVLSLGAMLDGDTPERRAQISRILRLLDDPILHHAPDDIRRNLNGLVRNLDLSPLTLDTIPEDVRRSLTRRVTVPSGGERELFLVVIEPRFRVAIADRATEFAASVDQVSVAGHEYFAAGEALIFADIVKIVHRESLRVLFLAGAAASVVLFLAFRSWQDLAFVLVTIAGAILMTLAVVSLLGLKVSFFNLVVLPVLCGIGVDYGVHVIHRARAEEISTSRAANELVRTIAPASATTAVGFMGLIFAHHPGLRSMGLTACLGIVLTAAGCLIFLPALRDAFESPGIG